MIKDPKAACLGMTDLFYGPFVDLRQEPEDERKAREARCVVICAQCQIKWPCLQWALAEEEPWGVWGGIPYQQRRHFRRFLMGRYGGIPDDEETLREAWHLFGVEQAKRLQARTKAKAIGKKNGSRTGSVITGIGSRRGTRQEASGQQATANGSSPRNGSGASRYGRAASPQGRRRQDL